LSYLMTAIAKYILRKERLPLTNLLYSGGGHFYLIMPLSFMKKLNEYRREMDALFLEAHRGKLAMLLSCVPLKPADFMDGQGRLPEKFNRLAELLQDEKNKKFYSVLKEEPGKIFGPFEEKGEPCPHCGYATHEDECGFCKSFEALGESLIKKKFLVEKWDDGGKNEKPVRRVQDIFEKLGLKLEFTDEPPGSGYRFAIKREALDLTRCCGYLQIPVGMKQDREGNIITFDQISDSARGIKVWGVLRGDVDNLGSIFKDGLGEITSFSRIITLSQEVSQFFNSNLELLLDGLHEADRFHNYENCSVVYAGGDDFFIVGPWDALPYVAEHINGEFRKYVGFNPAVTLSIAFEIAPDRKFPLYRVALSAGENLDEAKHFREEKNCFAFLGMPIGWENYEKFKELKEKITEVLVRYKVSRSLLSIVYRAFREYETSLESGEIYRSWRLFYYIARLKERCGKEAQEILDQILCALIEKDNRLYPYGFLSARWAEFETRR
ncbi:MAG: type III-A CRISPR-associated protein Cas10/Csm1, partial [Bacillota bacterium]